MKAKYALMTVAFSLATFTQAQNASQQEPKKATEILESLSASAAVPTLSLEKRVEKMPNLAMIPADTAVCFSVLNLGPTILDVMKSPVMGSFLEASAVSNIASSMGSAVGVKDIIVAGDARLEKTLTQIIPVLSVFYEGTSKLSLVQMLSPFLGYTSYTRTSVYTTAGTAMIDSLMKSGAAFLKEGELAPVLAVVSMDVDLLAECKGGIAQGAAFIAPASQGAVELYSGKHQGLDFSGIKLNGKNLAALLRQNLGQNPFDMEAMAKSIENRNLYFLFAFKDDKMLVSVCADPATMIKIAATPKESILATDKLAFTDHVAQPVMVGYCDAVFYDALQKYRDASSVASFKGYAAGAETAAQEGNIGDISGALASWKLVGDHYMEMLKMSKSNQPANMTIWWDNGFQMEMMSAGSGFLSSDKALKLASYANQADNIIYAAAAMNPASSEQWLAILENSVSATWQFAERILPVAIQHMKKDDFNRQILQMMPLVQMCKPELVKIWGSAKLALSGMDNESILIVDANGTAPQIPQKDPKVTAMIKKLQVPRFAYAKGISDRTKIASAWDQMTSSLEALLSSFSPPVEGEGNAMALGNPNKTEAKGVSTYTYPSPFFTTECKPCLSISDKVFVFGTSPGLNQSIAVAMTAPQTGNLKGSAFALKIAPVSKMIEDYVKEASALCPNSDPEIKQKIDSGLKALKYFDGIYGVMTDGDTIRMRLSIPMK